MQTYIKFFAAKNIGIPCGKFVIFYGNLGFHRILLFIVLI
jgi:hypothetical protein